MEKFSTHTGIGVPLRQSNVDTDQIIPAVYLKRITRTGFEDELIWKVLENAPGTEITVDLESKLVTAGTVVAPFHVDDYTRWRLLEGLDDIGLTLRNEPDITAFEATRPAIKPTTLPIKV